MELERLFQDISHDIWKHT
ncbi:hypothetical protein MTR67_030264 [Solanum verrucosum]|uniref:Uncharacterized protein n=1 Tax=Solanum verrucosum TaxID=315347 RepID=A0AAF0TYB0_SOLVR|nr:hypothetical protein MTR67_030264 [Solanum verrucosum]